jgi:hypothetical protein
VLGTVSWGRWEPRACGTSLPPFLKSLGRRSSVCTRGVTLHVPLTPQLPALHASFFNPGSASAAATAAAAVPPVPSAESLGEEEGEEGEEGEPGEGEKSGAADPVVDALLRLAQAGQPLLQPPPSMACLHCGTAGTMRCSRCRVAHYCSESCQRLHWTTEHNITCRALSAAGGYCFRMSPPPWARCYLAWCRIQLV